MSAPTPEDISGISNEEVLRRMWQDTDDYGRKKEIRAHIYKLRESRLSNFYNTNESSSTTATESITQGKASQLTTHHADSLADHSFMGMKTKEIRDSESPSRDLGVTDKILSLGDRGWNTIQSNVTTSDDGKIQTTSEIMTQSGTEDMNNSKLNYTANRGQQFTTYQDGDDNNFIKGSHAVVRQEAAAVSDDGRFSTSSTKTSSTSKTVSKKIVTSDEAKVTPQSTNIRTQEHHFDDKKSTDNAALVSCSAPSNLDGNTKVTKETYTLPDGTVVTKVRYETEGSSIVQSDGTARGSSSTITSQSTSKKIITSKTGNNDLVTYVTKEYPSTVAITQQGDIKSSVYSTRTEDKVSKEPKQDSTTVVKVTKTVHVSEPTQLVDDGHSIVSVTKLDAKNEIKTDTVSRIDVSKADDAKPLDNNKSRQIQRTPKPQDEYPDIERRKLCRPPDSEIDQKLEPTEGQYETTYRTDYTQKKPYYTDKRIHVEVSPTHEAFVRSLRAVSPEGLSRGSSKTSTTFPSNRSSPDRYTANNRCQPLKRPSHERSISPRKSPEKFSSSETITYNKTADQVGRRQIIEIDYNNLTRGTKKSPSPPKAIHSSTKTSQVQGVDSSTLTRRNKQSSTKVAQNSTEIDYAVRSKHSPSPLKSTPKSNLVITLDLKGNRINEIDSSTLTRRVTKTKQSPSSPTKAFATPITDLDTNETIVVPRNKPSNIEINIVNKNKKIQLRSPSSPLSDITKSPKETFRKSSLRDASPIKETSKRTNTYEERCKEILGLSNKTSIRNVSDYEKKKTRKVDENLSRPREYRPNIEPIKGNSHTVTEIRKSQYNKPRQETKQDLEKKSHKTKNVIEHDFNIISSRRDSQTVSNAKEYPRDDIGRKPFNEYSEPESPDEHYTTSDEFNQTSEISEKQTLDQFSDLNNSIEFISNIVEQELSSCSLEREGLPKKPSSSVEYVTSEEELKIEHPNEDLRPVSAKSPQKDQVEKLSSPSEKSNYITRAVKDIHSHSDIQISQDDVTMRKKSLEEKSPEKNVDRTIDLTLELLTETAPEKSGIQVTDDVTVEKNIHIKESLGTKLTNKSRVTPEKEIVSSVSKKRTTVDADEVTVDSELNSSRKSPKKDARTTSTETKKSQTSQVITSDKSKIPTTDVVQVEENVPVTDSFGKITNKSRVTPEKETVSSISKKRTSIENDDIIIDSQLIPSPTRGKSPKKESHPTSTEIKKSQTSQANVTIRSVPQRQPLADVNRKDSIENKMITTNVTCERIYPERDSPERKSPKRTSPEKPHQITIRTTKNHQINQVVETGTGVRKQSNGENQSTIRISPKQKSPEKERHTIIRTTKDQQRDQVVEARTSVKKQSVVDDVKTRKSPEQKSPERKSPKNEDQSTIRTTKYHQINQVVDLRTGVRKESDVEKESKSRLCSKQKSPEKEPQTIIRTSRNQTDEVVQQRKNVKNQSIIKDSTSTKSTGRSPQRNLPETNREPTSFKHSEPKDYSLDKEPLDRLQRKRTPVESRTPNVDLVKSRSPEKESPKNYWDKVKTKTTESHVTVSGEVLFNNNKQSAVKSPDRKSPLKTSPTRSVPDDKSSQGTFTKRVSLETSDLSSFDNDKVTTINLESKKTKDVIRAPTGIGKSPEQRRPEKGVSKINVENSECQILKLTGLLTSKKELKHYDDEEDLREIDLVSTDTRNYSDNIGREDKEYRTNQTTITEVGIYTHPSKTTGRQPLEVNKSESDSDEDSYTQLNTNESTKNIEMRNELTDTALEIEISRKSPEVDSISLPSMNKSVQQISVKTLRTIEDEDFSKKKTKDDIRLSQFGDRKEPIKDKITSRNKTPEAPKPSRQSPENELTDTRLDIEISRKYPDVESISLPLKKKSIEQVSALKTSRTSKEEDFSSKVTNVDISSSRIGDRKETRSKTEKPETTKPSRHSPEKNTAAKQTSKQGTYLQKYLEATNTTKRVCSKLSTLQQDNKLGEARIQVTKTKPADNRQQSLPKHVDENTETKPKSERKWPVNDIQKIEDISNKLYKSKAVEDETLKKKISTVKENVGRRTPVKEPPITKKYVTPLGQEDEVERERNIRKLSTTDSIHKTVKKDLSRTPIAPKKVPLDRNTMTENSQINTTKSKITLTVQVNQQKSSPIVNVKILDVADKNKINSNVKYNKKPSTKLETNLNASVAKFRKEVRNKLTKVVVDKVDKATLPSKTKKSQDDDYDSDGYKGQTTTIRTQLKDKRVINKNTINTEDDLGVNKTIIVNLRRSKSSKESSPDRICPLPVSFDSETTPPRYPDQIQEPEEDDSRSKPRRIFSISEDNASESTKIKEVDDYDLDETHSLSVSQKINKFITEAESLTAPAKLSEITKNSRTPSTEANVFEKISLFTKVAEDVASDKNNTSKRPRYGVCSDEFIRKENQNSLRQSQVKDVKAKSSSDSSDLLNLSVIGNTSTKDRKSENISPRGTTNLSSIELIKNIFNQNKDSASTTRDHSEVISSTSKTERESPERQKTSPSYIKSAQTDAPKTGRESPERPKSISPSYAKPSQRSTPDREVERISPKEAAKLSSIELIRNLSNQRRDSSVEATTEDYSSNLYRYTPRSSKPERTDSTVTLRSTGSVKCAKSLFETEPERTLKPRNILAASSIIEAKKVTDHDNKRKSMENVDQYDSRRSQSSERTFESSDLPGYMRPLDRSLRPNSPHRDSITQLKKIQSNVDEQVSISTYQKPSVDSKDASILGLSKITEEEIENIYNLEVLEELLKIVIGYDLRKKIRDQIRSVRKIQEDEQQLETVSKKLLTNERKMSDRVQTYEKTRKSPSVERKVVGDFSKQNAQQVRLAGKRPSVTTVAVRDRKSQSPPKEIKFSTKTESYSNRIANSRYENRSSTFTQRTSDGQNKQDSMRVQGTVITSQYHSENDDEPQVVVTKYSYDSKDLRPTNKKISKVALNTRKTINDSLSLKDVSGNKQDITYAVGGDSSKETKQDKRRSLVKVLSQKFIKNSVDTSKSDRQSSYPKAGLILHTTNFKESTNKERIRKSPERKEKTVVRALPSRTSSVEKSRSSKERAVQSVTNRTGKSEFSQEGRTTKHVQTATTKTTTSTTTSSRHTSSQVISTGLQFDSKARTRTKTTKTVFEQHAELQGQRKIRTSSRKIMAEQEGCFELTENESQEQISGTMEGESQLLPLLQGLLEAPDSEQTADSGTESGEDQRSGLIAEVQSALNKLSANLLGNTTGVSAERRDSLLQLVSKLQAGLAQSAPSINRHSDEQQGPLTNKRRQRTGRHTVGVSSEELADARKLIEEISMQEFPTGQGEGNKASHLQKQHSEGSVGQSSKSSSFKPFVPQKSVVKNAIAKPFSSSNSTVSGNSSSVQTPTDVSDPSIDLLFNEQNFGKTSYRSMSLDEHPSPSSDFSQNVNLKSVQEAVQQATANKMSTDHKGNISETDEDSTVKAHTIPSQDEDEDEEPLPESSFRMHRNPIYLQQRSDPDYDERNNRFLAKKLRMKRANTIDIPKAFRFCDNDNDSDGSLPGEDFAQRRLSNYLALRGPIKLGNGNVGNRMPSFEAKTENDKRFLAFINKHNETQPNKNSLWTKATERGTIWSNKFGDIKTTFEKASSSVVTPQSSARQFWKTSDNSDAKKNIDGRPIKRNVGNVFEGKQREPQKLPWSDHTHDSSNIVTGSLRVKTIESERPAKFAPQPVNQFSHAPQSAFRPLPRKILHSLPTENDNKHESPLYLYAPKPQIASPSRTWIANSNEQGRVMNLAASKFEKVAPKEAPISKPTSVKHRTLSSQNFQPSQPPQKITAPHLEKTAQDNRNIVRKLSGQYDNLGQRIDNYVTHSTTKYMPTQTHNYNQRPYQVQHDNAQQNRQYQDQNAQTYYQGQYNQTNRQNQLPQSPPYGYSQGEQYQSTVQTYNQVYQNQEPRQSQFQQPHYQQQYQQSHQPPRYQPPQYQQPQSPYQSSQYQQPEYQHSQYHQSQYQPSQYRLPEYQQPQQNRLPQNSESGYQQSQYQQPVQVRQPMQQQSTHQHQQTNKYPSSVPVNHQTNEDQCPEENIEEQQYTSTFVYKPVSKSNELKTELVISPTLSAVVEPPKLQTQKSVEKVREYTAVSSKIMTGPVSQQAQTIRQKSPMNRDEHEISAALGLQKALQKINGNEHSRKNIKPISQELTGKSNSKPKTVQPLQERRSSGPNIIQPQAQAISSYSSERQQKTLSSQSFNYPSTVSPRLQIPLIKVPESPKIPTKAQITSKADSWNQICVQQQPQHKPSPRSSPNARSVQKSKSSHSLVVPKQFEAGMSKDEMAQKKRTLEAFFVGIKSPQSLSRNSSTDSLDTKTETKVTKRSINRIKTSEKISAHRHSSGLSLSRSRTLPDIVCPELLDESNVDKAFDDLFKSSS